MGSEVTGEGDSRMKGGIKTVVMAVVLFWSMAALSQSHDARSQLELLLTEAYATKKENIEKFGASGGVLVVAVARGRQGSRAGLKVGDILLSYNEIPLETSDHVIELVRTHRKRKKVSLAYIRGGQRHRVWLKGGKIGIGLYTLEETRNPFISTDPEDHWLQKYSDMATRAFNNFRYPQALKYFEQGLAKAKSEKTKRTFYSQMGRIHEFLGNHREALDNYLRFLRSIRQIGDRYGELLVLVNIASTYARLDEYDNALNYGHQAMQLAGKLKQRVQELKVVGNLAATYMEIGQKKKGRRYFTDALRIARELQDKTGEGLALMNIGIAQSKEGQKRMALESFEKAKKIADGLSDKGLKMMLLNNIGGVYWTLGQYQRALKYYQEMETFGKTVKDPQTTLSALDKIADLHNFMGMYEKSLVFRLEALELSRKERQRYRETRHLEKLGALYSKLGKTDAAVKAMELAMTISESLNNPGAVAVARNSLAIHYSNIGELDKSRKLYIQTLNEFEQKGNRKDSATVQSNLARLYKSQGEFDKALNYYEKSLRFYRDERLKWDEGNCLNLIGEVHQQSGKFKQALDYYFRSLSVLSLVENKDSLWDVWDKIRQTLERLGQPRAAIFAGKMAVNIIQRIRLQNTELEKGLQSSYLAEKEPVYHGLAELLIRQGRIPEAQQVLAMLKESEYLDFTRRELPRNDQTLAQFNPFEREQSEILQRNLFPLRKIYDPLTELLQIETGFLSKLQQRELQRFQAEWQTANSTLNQGLYTMVEAFSGLDEEQARLQATKLKLDTDHRQLIADLIDAGSGEVLLLQYLVLEKNSRLLVTAKDAIHPVTLDIGADRLNRLVNDFYRTLKDPRRNPRSLGKALYSHLIEPVEGLLSRYQPKTLMLYLDGVLRYIPMGALYDGKTYLAERYALPIFTAAARERLQGKRVENLRITGFGVSKAYKPFSALPAVKDELNGIVREGGSDTGILPGSVKLNEAFTQASLRKGLRDSTPIIHLATHFAFKPGNEKASFLLLGDGNHLDLGTVRTRGFDFKQVDLLTLSACETALDSPNAKGREIEGFGTLAQKKGAKSVLATLWSVADKSTGLFMRKLYRLKQEEGLGKAAALRKAQISFIRGDATTLEAGVNESKEQSALNLTNKKAKLSAAFGSSTPFAHPFYWAPFILMGNWL